MAQKILIVDDSPTTLTGISRMVQAMRHEPLTAASGEQAVEIFVREHPAIVLLDVNMPGINGYETAKRIRDARPEEWVPIIFLSASEYDQDLERAIESGGDDYLVKPVSAVVLSAKIRALQRLDGMRRKLRDLSDELSSANRRLEQVSQLDGLTGLANRRHFDNFLAHQVAVARRRREPFSLMLCDVDRFKPYNDRYGHLAGDECLRKIAGVLTGCCRRGTDLAARYGGEEFVLVLPDTPAAGAEIIAERARQDLAALAIPHADSQPFGIVTLSAGIGVFGPESDQLPESLIARADEALYRAKETGRNRIVVASPAS
jgi:diguanylate cyclase (GGDEF)-like protein